MDFSHLKQLFFPHTNTTPFFSLNTQTHWGRVVSCYDADTMTVVLNTFNGFYKYNLRLNGIDTCEMKSKIKENKERAIRARNRVLQWIGVLSEDADLNVAYTRQQIQTMLEKDVYLVWIHCLEFDKYGRLLAEVYKAPYGESCSQMLIQEKYAYLYGGDTKLTEEQQNQLLS